MVRLTRLAGGRNDWLAAPSSSAAFVLLVRGGRTEKGRDGMGCEGMVIKGEVREGMGKEVKEWIGRERRSREGKGGEEKVKGMKE